ncbi:hypothetical protein [Planktothrix agardhii]|uniref:hypothetical protein n=1 Tax=Planktothrix agardhii TaxID=1160 RepID=UPI001D09A57C|nr:hypothetical protein [Planktothrix agardhii]MCF3609776.1 hypothetical protein [Planktothrix agardhii 1033]
MTFNIFRGWEPFNKAIAIGTDQLLGVRWWRVNTLKSIRATARALIIHTAPRVVEVWQFLQSTDTCCRFGGLYGIVK